MGNTWISTNLLSRDTVEIGRFVLDVENPEQDHFDPISNSSITPSELRLDQFSDTVVRSKNSTFTAFLTKIFSSSYDARGEHSTAVESAVCITYQLRNSGEYFHDACKSDSTRQWLTQAIRRRKKVYLVVGIKTLTDAQISLRKTRSKEVRGSVDLPLTQFTQIPGSSVDISFLGSRGRGFEGEQRFMVPGEHIFAVQYRKVDFAWFSRLDLDKAGLKKGGKWEVYLGGRGGGGADEDQVVEPLIQGYVEEDDLDTESESFVFGNEEMLFVP